MHTNLLEMSRNCRFWFSWPRVGPERLDFPQAPGWYSDATGLQSPQVWVARTCQHHRREEWVADRESCHCRKDLKSERAEIWDRGFIWVPFVLRTFGQVGKKWVMLKSIGSTLQEPHSLAPGHVFSVWESPEGTGRLPLLTKGLWCRWTKSARCKTDLDTVQQNGEARAWF